MIWDESKHPRDEDGKFTFKTGGNSETLKGGIEKSSDSTLNIFNGLEIGEIKDVLFSVLGNLVTPAIKIYSSIHDLKQMIKNHKLDNKLNLAIKNIKAEKASNKRIGLKNSRVEKNTINVNNVSNVSKNKINKETVSLSDRTNKSNRNTNFIHLNTTTKPSDILNKHTNINSNNNINNNTPTDILYKDRYKNEKAENEYRNELLNVLGDKATQGDILYSKPEELEKKIREFGLEEELNKELGEEITGAATSINNQTDKKFVRPVDGIIKSDFGPRIRPVEGASKNHQGIDFRASIGTPVKAVASGTVTKAGTASGYGIAVYIDHGIINGKHIISEYGHLSKCNVKAGDKIKAGQIVAKSGNTGHSSGPHLHLTIKENGKAVDPKKYIKLK